MLLRSDQQRKRAGFTLMEIIVVVAIILILAGAGALVLPKFLVDANINRAKLDCKTLQQAVSAYFTKNNGVYPQTLDQLAERQPDNSPAYIEERVLLDPWNSRYILDLSQRHPKTDMPLIMSNGPPGQNMPIRNWVELGEQ